VTAEPMSCGVLLDIILKNKDELVQDAKAGGNLGCDEPEEVSKRSGSYSRSTSSKLRRGQSR